MGRNFDKEIDRLYGASPDEFVRRRDELARTLKKDGDGDAATEVKGLRRPTRAAWAVNQLARREKMGIRALLTAGERLREAHAGLLAGGSPDAVRRASEDERKALAALSRAAEQILAETGTPDGQTLERVRETLHAAAVEEELAELVRSGRLQKEQEAAGLGLEAAAALPSPRRGDGGKRRREKARERNEAAARRLRDAKRAAEEAEQAVKEAEREVGRAERELRSRRAELESAERALERARKVAERRSGG